MEDDSTSGDGEADSLLAAIARAPAIDPPQSRIGLRFGRYRIDALLGSGGMGVVYRAHDTTLGRDVALKLVRDELVNDASQRARLLREARSVAAITHPNVVTLYDAGEASGHTYLAMELVPGESLRERLARSLLEVDEVLAVVRCIAAALGAAHARHVLHRDLKPENVMLGNDGVVKVLDFGLAKSMTSSDTPDGEAQTITAAGALAGTPSYMSPEQLGGLALDARSDVFAFGIVLYEMLAGERPFAGSTANAVAAAILRDAPRPIEEHRDDLSPELIDLVHGCLAKAPTARPSSGEALTERLRVFGPASARASRPARLRADSVDLPAETATTIAPPPPRVSVRPWGRRLLWLGALATAGALTIFAAVRLRAPRSTESARDGSVPSAAPMGFADVPMSPTTSEEARAKFHEGMRELAAGDWMHASTTLDAARAADPGLASAALQRSYIAFMQALALRQVDRETFHDAVTHREALGPRDRALLDALTPSFADPPNWPETEQRLRAYLADHEGDAQFWASVGVLALKQTHYEDAVAAFEKVAMLAPSEVAGHQMWSQAVKDGGDRKTARRILDECMAKQPSESACRRQAWAMANHDLDCAAADRLAREMTSLDPRSAAGWYRRARSASALGADGAAVAELQATARSFSDEKERPLLERQDALALAMRRGDFTAYSRLALDVERLAPPGSWDTTRRGTAEIQRLYVLWQSGDSVGAGRAAMKELARLPALDRPERFVDDMTPYWLRFAFDGKQLDAASMRARRGAWIAGQRPTVDEATWRVARVNVWSRAYNVLSPPPPAEATEAFAALAALGGELPDPETPGLDRESIGALLLALGRAEEAIKWLLPSTGGCVDFEPPANALLFLGMAYERNHDQAHACAAYGRLFSYWPHPIPRSVSVDGARARAKELGCPPTP